MEESLPDEVKDLAVQVLGSSEDDWWVRDLTDTYKWLGGEKVFWVIESDTDRSMMAVLSADKTSDCLNCSDDSVSAISRIIRTNLGDKAIERLGVEGFARLLAEWRSDPRCYLATPRFFEVKQDEINDWLLGTEHDPQALRDICVEPAINKDLRGNWTIAYNVIDRFGGVDRWSVKGASDDFVIQAIDISTVKEKGSFYYPDEL